MILRACYLARDGEFGRAVAHSFHRALALLLPRARDVPLANAREAALRNDRREGRSDRPTGAEPGPLQRFSRGRAALGGLLADGLRAAGDVLPRLRSDRRHLRR